MSKADKEDRIGAMSALTTTYCLKEITDYLEFDRFFNDLMLLEGCRSIEPHGGFIDKVGDAIHVGISGETTI